MQKKFLLDIFFCIVISAILAAFLYTFFYFDPAHKQLIIKTPKIKNLDKVAFSYNNKNFTDYLICGLPGDTIEIINGIPYINSKPVPNYFSNLFIIDLQTSPKIYNPNNLPLQFVYLSYPQYYKLKKHLLVTPVTLPLAMADTSVYPYNKQISWNKDNFGPLIVPHIDMILKLNKITYLLYKPIIQKYEHHSIYMKNNKIFIDGKPKSYYRFKNNYFFVLCPNLHFKKDSRTWGPLPWKNLYGKIFSIKKIYHELHTLKSK